MEFSRTQILRTLAVAIGLVLLGVWAFVLRGAGGPADPVLGPSVTAAPTGSTSTVPGFVPPGVAGRIPLEGFEEIAIAVEPEDGGATLFWCLLAALTAEQRGRGLMGVNDLHGYSGMAFVYDQDSTNPFYMRDTPTPLSIAWVGADGRVVTITDMAPCGDREGCPLYSPSGPYRTAIEVFDGELPALGITAGATVHVGGRCAPT